MLAERSSVTTTVRPEATAPDRTRNTLQIVVGTRGRRGTIIVKGSTLLVFIYRDL